MCNDLNLLSYQLEMNKLPLFDIKYLFQSNDSILIQIEFMCLLLIIKIY
ncbi:hypothetical protein M2263_002219 [Providencia alcalifaciens]|nr:hypothetical protein [Providencia alcalifaciens]